MNKRILIVNNNLHIGGVQRALVDLLGCIHDKYDITLLLFHPSGEFCDDIPEDVKVISPDSGYRFIGMTKYDAETHFIWKIIRGALAALTRIFGRKYAVSLMSLGQKTLSGYDAAISFLHNGNDKIFYGGCCDFVLKHTDAAKKIAFLHCDYENCGADTKENAKMYARFDLIAACSDGVGQSFARSVPALADKTVTVNNCHDFERIRTLANSARVELSAEHINILTVARLGREKGVSRGLKAVAALGELKNRVHYYIIGDGIERQMLEELIKRLDLEDTVTLCGELENPYGYMQAADLLLIPSLSEAAPLVIAEAACLGTPILSAETLSAKEMICESGFGWVCENTEEGMAELLRELICSSDIIKEKKCFLAGKEFDNNTAVAQFERII